MATAIGERLNSYTQTRGFGGNLESDNNFQRQQSDVNNFHTHILILSSKMDMMKTPAIHGLYCLYYIGNLSV